MFSIIIPLYNKEKYIAKAIESVLQQTYNRFELIVVNDGSNDNSLEAVEQIVKSTNQQINIINQSNQGVSAARNNGVKVASFEYIAFLDADDWWHPDFLKSIKELIDDFPDAGIYASAYYTIKNGKSKQSVFGLGNNYKGYLNYFTAYSYAWWMPLTSISVAIPKEIYVKQQGFKKSLKFGEDVDLWLRIVLSHRIAFINKPLAYYNQDVDLKSRALGGKIWNPEHHYIFNLEYLKQEEDNNSEVKKLIDGLRVRALLRYYLSGKFQSHTMLELKKVDFKNQPLYFRRIYKYPRFVLTIYFNIKKRLSFVKQKLIQRFL